MLAAYPFALIFDSNHVFTMFGFRLLDDAFLSRGLC